MAISYTGLMEREQRIADTKREDRDRMAGLYAALGISPLVSATDSTSSTTSTSTDTETMKLNIATLKKLGASDTLIAEASGFNPKDLAVIVEDLESKNAEYAGTPMSLTKEKVDAYLTTLIRTTSPGTKPDRAKIAALSGIDDDLLDQEIEGMGGLTHWEFIERNTTTPPSIRVKSVTEFGDKLDSSDIKNVLAMADDEVGNTLTNEREKVARQRQLNDELANPDIKLRKRLAESSALLESAEESLKKGNRRPAIDLVGGNVILQQIFNNPNLVKYDLGPYSSALITYDDWVDSNKSSGVSPRVFMTDEEAKEAYKAKVIKDGDIIIVNNKVGLAAP